MMKFTLSHRYAGDGDFYGQNKVVVVCRSPKDAVVLSRLPSPRVAGRGLAFPPASLESLCSSS